LVGYAKTTRLLARAEILNSAEAKALGLIDEAAEPDADFDDAFEAYIDTMKRQPVQVMRAIKSVASGYRLQDRAGDEDVETEHFATCWAHADHWAAVDKMASKGKNQ
jgi:enoyl-CoA hydratase/carnithine racemase